MADKPKKKGGVSLAFLLGSEPKKGKEPAEDAMSDDYAEDEEMDPAFESAAIEAFPDLEGSPERIAALKRAIHACYDEG